VSQVNHLRDSSAPSGMVALLFLFIATAAMADTTNSFVPFIVIETGVFRRAKATAASSTNRVANLAASKAAGITNGITLGQVVTNLGPGWITEDESIGIINWSFSDGRTLRVWPRGYMAGTVLTTNKNENSRFWFEAPPNARFVLPKK